MTSPAQLKYLDAIGIPVWVSRDRLVDVNHLSDPQSDKQPKLSTDSDCIGSADDILQNLENAVVSKNPIVDKKAEDKPSSVTHTDSNSQPINNKPATELVNQIAHTETHSVFACGDVNAEWLVIGESPDSSESQQNQPFSADSGVLLSNMLKSIGIQNPREDAYLINIIKNGTSTNNSNLNNEELSTILYQQIKQVEPKIIFIVGQISAQMLLQSSEPLIRLRSKVHQLSDFNIPTVVSYYPSYLLSKPSDKRKAWDDLKLALSIIIN